MSSTIKRVALVAVAALGLGMVTSISANAADNDIYCTTASSGSSSSSVACSGIAGANNFVVLTVERDGGVAAATPTVVVATGSTLVSGSTSVSGSGTSSVSVTGQTDVTLNVPTTAAGTIVVKSYAVTNGVQASTATKTVTITVDAATSLSTSLSTARMGDPSWTAADSFTVTANAVARSAAKASGTDIAQVQVYLKKNDNTADSAAHTVTAFVSSGVGFVAVDTSAGTASASARVASATASSGYAYVHIDSDGNAGTGEVTVQVTDAVSGAVTTLGKFTYTSFGSVASIGVDTVNLSIGRSGGYTLGDSASADDAAIILVTKDSNGKEAAIASSGVPTVTSSDVTKVASGTCAADADAVGYYNCSFTTATSSKSGDKATLTFKTANPAVSGTYLTTTVDVTIGGSVASQVLTLDATSYAPGDALTLTITAKDSSGNPVYDGAATPATWTSSKTVIGLPSAASTYVGGKKAYSTAIYAPSAEGDFSITATGTDADATKVSVSASVSGATSSALDAANEATDAANAATDAANAAAEAADAATAAAQDAQAAVAELATKVASLMAGIKAQITSLTNLVIKIQKKVKA